MRAVRAVDPAQATADGKRPCLGCFPAGAMPYLPMPATETFGHEPVEIHGEEFCARCRAHGVDEDGDAWTHPLLWPCASAVVLGLAVPAQTGSNPTNHRES